MKVEWEKKIKNMVGKLNYLSLDLHGLALGVDGNWSGQLKLIFIEERVEEIDKEDQKSQTKKMWYY